MEYELTQHLIAIEQVLHLLTKTWARLQDSGVCRLPSAIIAIPPNTTAVEFDAVERALARVWSKDKPS